MAQKDTANRESLTQIEKLHWKRFALLTWPVLITVPLAVHFYFAEIHATLSLLTQYGVPLNRWLDHFEVENQLFPFAFLLMVTIMILFQSIGGNILFMLATGLFAIVSGTVLLRGYAYGFPDSTSLMRGWGIFVTCSIASISTLITLSKIERIDKELTGEK